MRNEYLSREPIEDGLNIPVSVWQEIEDYWDEDPNKALQYLMAMGRYCFYGDEPNNDTTSRDVVRSVKALIPHIDAQRMRYRKAKEGGKANASLSDTEFIELLQSTEFKSQAEVARTIGVTRQAISQRLKSLGVTLRGEKVSGASKTSISTSDVYSAENVKKRLDSVM